VRKKVEESKEEEQRDKCLTFFSRFSSFFFLFYAIAELGSCRRPTGDQMKNPGIRACGNIPKIRAGSIRYIAYQSWHLNSY
jgi:hypothetical protein